MTEVLQPASEGLKPVSLQRHSAALISAFITMSQFSYSFYSLLRVAVSGCVGLFCLLLAGCDGRHAEALPDGGAGVTLAATPAVPKPSEALYAPPAGRPLPSAAALGQLGRLMFFDTTLSASGKMSCASCHDPQHAFGPPSGLPVEFGGPDGRTQGPRAVPSLRYLQTLTAFSEHHHDNDGDDSIDAGPTGGRMWDGRAGSAHEQAGLPLLSADEMANPDVQTVTRKLAESPYADKLKAAFGDDVFSDPQAVFRAAGQALEVFQESPTDFYPFTSKYDAVLRGQQRLNLAEARGLTLFNDPAKGNCASCHISRVTPDGAFPMFSDFGLIALGVPRNPQLLVNRNAAYSDMGLCGPIRTDLQDRPEYCGLFRTPSLRNVGVRRTFFHNGAVHSLEDAIRFYVERDTRPERWYPKSASGVLRKFDDLPTAFHANINMEPPFGQHRGDKPSLSEAEIRDVAAFLRSLTDADQVNARADRNR
jgi:cytochrome c peroxidase